MATKKAPAKKSRARAPKPRVQGEGAEGGKVVMAKAPQLPPRTVPGRPNDKYHKLLEAVIGEFGVGVPVRLMEYSDSKTAYRVANDILREAKPVPGGPGAWEIRAVQEKVEAGSGTKDGSVLYVEWLGEV